MLRDITLGQYFPGNTIVHRLDPRTKLALTVCYMVALFAARTWSGYAFMLAVLISAVAASRINGKTLLKSLKPILFIIIFTVVLNVFFTAGDDVLAHFWIFKITKQGLVGAAQMMLRLTMLIAGTFLLTYTTSPLALTDGIESILKPLAKIHFPAHVLAMMMSIALRFIPTLIEETDKIMSAQKARGADFESGGLVKRAKALLPILVPLFVSAFRRADELAEAMESRCYRGGEGRTRMKTLVMRPRDWVALAAGAAVISAVYALFRRLP
ncbi:MAG: energy-coupling factor transporter transmembrane protein EcfT [Oscillospiraceae bacterium]|jgi:energy-coupling factor transport system permease protein|nr:energy-coupling factor transporter transmembrane protein EcfT [Oscillospiraceae bacterium]